MFWLTNFLAALALAISTVTIAAYGQTTTFHDASGRVTGRARIDSNNVTTYYGPSGMVTGHARTDTNGVTTLQDASGRVTGKASERK